MNAVLWTLGGLLTLTLGLALFAWTTNRRIDASFKPAGSFIDVPGARLHVVDRGAGPVILMVHGLGGQLRHYTYGVEKLLSKNFRVVAVDRPGSGHSLRHDGASASMEAQADALAALLDKLRIASATVVGHSLGGAISLMLAARHPQRVAALALVAPLTHTPEGLPAPFRGLDITHPALRKFIAWTFAVPGFIARSPAIMKTLFSPEAHPKDFATRAGGLMSLKPSQFIAASTDLAAIPHSLPTLEASYARLKLPVSMLYGRGDLVLDPQLHAKAFVDKVPHTQLTLVDGGHMLPVTQVVRTAAFIEAAALQANTVQ
ncbi:MAG: alpha/beta hydrolase [Pseudomonadota bacterium]